MSEYEEPNTDESLGENPSSAIRLALVVSRIGGLITSAWLLYMMFAAGGIVSGLIWIVVLGIAWKFGVSVMFIVATSVLHFHFQVVGLWLPLLAYVLGAVTLLDAIKREGPH